MNRLFTARDEREKSEKSNFEVGSDAKVGPFLVRICNEHM